MVRFCFLIKIIFNYRNYYYYYYLFLRIRSDTKEFKGGTIKNLFVHKSIIVSLRSFYSCLK